MIQGWRNGTRTNGQTDLHTRAARASLAVQRGSWQQSGPSGEGNGITGHISMPRPRRVSDTLKGMVRLCGCAASTAWLPLPCPALPPSQHTWRRRVPLLPRRKDRWLAFPRSRLPHKSCGFRPVQLAGDAFPRGSAALQLELQISIVRAGR